MRISPGYPLQPLLAVEWEQPGTYTLVCISPGSLCKLGCVRGGLRSRHQEGSEAGVGLMGRVEADLLNLWRGWHLRQCGYGPQWGHMLPGGNTISGGVSWTQGSLTGPASQGPAKLRGF